MQIEIHVDYSGSKRDKQRLKRGFLSENFHFKSPCLRRRLDQVMLISLQRHNISNNVYK